MSRQRLIFVGTTVQDADLIDLVEQTFGLQFTHEEGSDPFIRVRTAAVYLGEHEFDDDDIAWPGGSETPLRSKTRAMIEIRDTSGDHCPQQDIADKIFASLRSEGCWQAVYIDDMQEVLDSIDP
jgi:hypothetical protein